MPRLEGEECDEYAFASTKEGAASGGPYDIKMIDANQNQTGGIQLGSMYLQQRMLNNNHFSVIFYAVGQHTSRDGSDDHTDTCRRGERARQLSPVADRRT
ncbi:NucA/NucB deoxyribonuclease domain-containing protein [Amycolatopsis sp. NPDC051716]|uniref:NucA/NucB deoxyribonuclease domain-containing protein n=1 Tax=Amycolatopsis sp. NPDC051716 TaxID=3155804 RepID=UPI00343F0E08